MTAPLAHTVDTSPSFRGLVDKYGQAGVLLTCLDEDGEEIGMQLLHDLNFSDPQERTARLQRVMEADLEVHDMALQALYTHVVKPPADFDVTAAIHGDIHGAFKAALRVQGSLIEELDALDPEARAEIFEYAREAAMNGMRPAETSTDRGLSAREQRAITSSPDGVGI